MNTREIFDKVKSHLLTQNARARNHRGECVYRSDSGRKCAIGCLIEDEHYSKDLESYALEAMSVRGALQKSGIDMGFGELVMLEKLRNIHDQSPIANWPRELDELEKEVLA